MTITIPVKFDADTSDLDQEINKSVGAGSKAAKSLKSAAVPAAAALAGLGAAAVKFGNAAAEDAQSQVLLAKALQNTANASKSQIAGAEDFISAMSKQAAVADDELRPALAALVSGTGSVVQGQAALRVALDIAAQTGKPLATVSAALAKGYGGQTSALGRLIPGLDKAAIKAGDMTTIMNQLAEKTGGAAAAAADTAAGKTKAMQIAMDEAQESIGTALLPVMGFLADKLVVVADFVAENTTLVKILAGVIAGLATAVLLINGAMAAYAAITKVVAAGQAALNFVLAANPIGIVVIAIAALVAGLVIAYKKSETFRDIVNGAFSVVKNVVGAVVTFITEKVPAAFTAMVNTVKTGVATVVEFVTGIPTAILGLHVKMLNAGKDLIGALFDGIKAGAGAVGGFIGDIAGKLKDAINDLLNLPLTVGPLSVLGKQVLGKVTLIPAFANGTNFAPGGLALVGERGPELVNLPRGSQVSTAAETQRALGATEVNVFLPTGDPQAAAMSVLNALAAAGR